MSGIYLHRDNLWLAKVVCRDSAIKKKKRKNKYNYSFRSSLTNCLLKFYTIYTLRTMQRAEAEIWILSERSNRFSAMIN